MSNLLDRNLSIGTLVHVNPDVWNLPNGDTSFLCIGGAGMLTGTDRDQPEDDWIIFGFWLATKERGIISSDTIAEIVSEPSHRPDHIVTSLELILWLDPDTSKLFIEPFDYLKAFGY